jgi:hypothetical protein
VRFSGNGGPAGGIEGYDLRKNIAARRREAKNLG